MDLLIIRSKLFVAFICLLALTSCSNYGKKVTFTGHKGEVYYKGDGVTEADAKAVGKFLEDQGFFAKDDKKRSVQITKDTNRIKARFVIDEKALATLANADDNFAIIGAAMSKRVFNSLPVDVIYTDEYFKDIKTIPYKPAALALANAQDEIKQMQKKEHNKNTLYYSKEITEEEAAAITNYLVKSEFFSDGGNNDVILTKTQGNAFHFRFSVKPSFANEEGLQKVDAFVKELKNDLFANATLEFEVMDENMGHIKTFTY